MNKIQKDVLVGVLLGIVLCLISTVFYVVVVLPIDNLSDGFLFLKRENLLTKVLTLGALPNGFLFYFFINKNQLYKARGVLISLLLLAFFFLIYNII